MFYKITFFKLDISSDDWLNFFNHLFSVTSKLKLTLLRNGRRIDFYISSDKKIDALNSKMFPFYLTDEIIEPEKRALNLVTGNLNPLPTSIRKNLFDYLEKSDVKGNEIIKIAFSLNKYNPLKTLPVLEITYLYQGKTFRRKAFLLNHLSLFLTLNLSKSINSEITKVKPVLTATNLSFDTFDQGILETKFCPSGKKLSVKSYDFWRHSLITGQSGSGKTYLLKLFIEDLRQKYANEYTIVLIDPHANLNQILTAAPLTKTIDFKQTSTNLFVNIGQPTLSTELTIDLFSTVMNIHENQNLARVLKYTLNLLFGINKMDLNNLKKLLTDGVFRKQILKETTDRNLLQFFDTEYQQLFTSQYSIAVLPILNLISELDFIKNVSNTVDLVEEINNNFLVSLPIKQADLGKNITKVIGGAIIQQLFTVMQAGLVKKKVILVIDEVSIVQTPSLVHILSEARKFALTVILSQQYLNQVSVEILRSIFANMVNYFSFKVSRDDAETLARNLNFEIDEYFLKNKNDPKEMLELGVKLLTDLNPREVISRIMVNDRYISPFKSKTIDVKIEEGTI